MSDERLAQLATQLLSEGYLDNEADAWLAARRILWVVDDLPGDPPLGAEALPG
jgi:hypothetical protein